MSDCHAGYRYCDTLYKYKPMANLEVTRRSKEKVGAQLATAAISFGGSLTFIIAVRLIAACTSPIMDCDETFNYMEPLHFMSYRMVK